jgi:small subunit ribosomal protein S13
MARISGITIPNEKQIKFALCYVYGIGPKTSLDILERAKVEVTVRAKDLTDAEISRIQDVINERLIVEGELHRVVTANIKRLKEIKSTEATDTAETCQVVVNELRQTLEHVEVKK